MQYCPCEARSKNWGKKQKSVLKGIELNYFHHSWLRAAPAKEALITTKLSTWINTTQSFRLKCLSWEKQVTFLLDNNIEGSKIMINCGSQAAIRAINSTVIKNNTTLEATMALNQHIGRIQ